MNEPPTSNLHTRRHFLRTSILGGAMAWTVPLFVDRTFFALNAAAADSALQTTTGKDSPILVIVQLAGGNDGLNTIVPFGDDAYHRARPKLAIKGDGTLKLSDHLGMHPNLTGMRSLMDEGRLAIVQGVGYPNPNRSHFRSTDIWATASGANEYETQGWIGRYFDNCCRGEDPTVGVAIGSAAPLTFAASEPKGVVLSRPEAFRYQSEAGADPEALGESFREMNAIEESGASIDMLASGSGVEHSGDNLDFLRKTSMDTQISSDSILELARKVKSTNVSYPGSRLGSSLSLVARMIAGGLPTRVFYVSQGGYDTHANQSGAHDNLMRELDQALKAFTDDMRAQGNQDRVLVMTFSEFGRRVAENGSGGTDHGAAAPLFVIGNVVGGVHGKHPSLTDLHQGDVKFGVDFRSVYATVLENWLGAPGKPILKGNFPKLNFLV